MWRNLIYIFVPLLAYSLFDIATSASTGNAGSSRTLVYFALLIVLSIMALCVIKHKIIPKTNIFTSMLLFAMYICIDTIIVPDKMNRQNLIYLMMSVWWLITVTYFWYLTRKNINNTKKAIILFFEIMFVVFSIAVVYGSINIRANYAVEQARVGYVYYLLSMLPIIMLDDNKKRRTSIVIIAIILTIISFKRGAIIALPIMLMVFYVTENRIKKASHDITRVLKVIAVIAIALFIGNIATNGYIEKRFSQDEIRDGSGRSIIWKEHIEAIKERPLIPLSLGVRVSNERVPDKGAHNEWINVLYLYGIIGLLLYLVVHISIIVGMIQLIKIKSTLAPVVSSLSVLIIILSVISGFYFVHSTFYVMGILGIAQNELRRKKEIT